MPVMGGPGLPHAPDHPAEKRPLMADSASQRRKTFQPIQLSPSLLALVSRVIFLGLGIVIGAISVQLFLRPFDIAPSGVTGAAVLLNATVGTPIGLMVLILNIPILILGYRYLGGIRVVITTIITVVGYSLMLDLIGPMLPEDGVSTDPLLNAIFGGVTGGISGAFVMRAGGTYGGTSTIAIVVQRRTGTPLSTTYLYTDMAIIGLAGLVFGWESALYATVVLFLSGVATDYVLEGPSIIRVVFIITNKPREVADVVLYQLQRGVTAFDGRGMYTDSERAMLFVTISRAEVATLRDLVATVDEHAFVVVGQGHTAYGSGFRRKNGKKPAVSPPTDNQATG